MSDEQMALVEAHPAKVPFRGSFDDPVEQEGFAAFPLAVLRLGLSSDAVLLYLGCCALVWGENTWRWRGAVDLSRRVGLPEERVLAVLGELEEAGLVQFASFAGQDRLLVPWPKVQA